MIRKKPVFSLRNCVSCSICAQGCPVSCISMTLYGKQGKYKNLFPEINEDICIGCSQCAAACPMGCIEME